jgi:hypothetical protein
MRAVLQPWQILVAAMAGWLTRQQQAAVEYLREENRILREQLGRRRLRLTDANVDASPFEERPLGVGA